MALVDLGTFPLNTGAPFIAYPPFTYDQNTAIGLGCIFTSTDFNNIFSSVELRTFLTPTGIPSFIESTKYPLDIINVIQVVLIPFSPLYFNSGTCSILARRIPTFRGAGDGTPVSLQLIYDDAVTVPSWRA